MLKGINIINKETVYQLTARGAHRRYKGLYKQLEQDIQELKKESQRVYGTVA